MVGALFVYAWLSYFGNGLEKYTDIVSEYTSAWNSNKSCERALMYILSVLGAGAMTVYYSYGYKKGYVQPLKEVTPKTNMTLKLLMISMIVASATEYIVYSSINPIVYSVLILAVIAYLINKRAAYDTVILFVIYLYAVVGSYRLYVLFGGKRGLDVMEVILISFLATSFSFGLSEHIGPHALTRSALIAQMLIPFTMLIFIASKYKVGEDIVTLPLPRRITCLTWLIIAFLLARAIASLHNNWSKSNSIEEVLSFGTLICVMNFNNYSGSGQIISKDLHHPFENIIGFSQIFELGQKPFTEYIPVSGMYSVFQGFFLWALGKGQYAYYYLTENFFYLVISVSIIWLLKKHLHGSSVLFISMLIPILRYNRVTLIIPIMLFLMWPKLIENKNLWLKAWFLTSLINGLYYPVFGAAVCMGFLPLAINQFISYIRGDFNIESKKRKFWIEWGITILPALLCIPLLLGTLKHMRAMGGQTVFADGISRFGQTLPQDFFGYVQSVGLRLFAYDTATFLAPAAVVWISAYLVIRVGKLTFFGNNINRNAAAISSSFGIAMLVSFAYTSIRIDIDRIYSRSAGIIYASAVMIIVITAKYLNKSRAAYVLVGLAVFIVTLNSGESIYRFNAASKLKPCYTVASDYVLSDNRNIPKLGTCFVQQDVYNGIVDRYNALKDSDTSKGYLGIGRFGHYYLLSIKGDSVMERATIKGYDAVKETVDLMKKNGTITNAVDSFTQYYFYHWLIMSGEYVWSAKEHRFYPNNEGLTIEEVRERHKNVRLAPDERELGRTPTSWGSSMESLNKIFTNIPVKATVTINENNALVSFEKHLKGEEADFMYIEFADADQNYENILFNHNEDVMQTTNNWFSKNLMKRDYSRGKTVTVFWDDDDGIQHSMNCSLGRGKLLIPLGAGCNWLLNDHSGLKISITDGDKVSKIPSIRNVKLLKVREVE